MSTFYKNYLDLCNFRGVTPSRAALDMRISKTSVTRWKQGYTPTDANLRKIADYFGVTVDYLLGNEKTSAENGEGLNKNTVKIAGRDGSYVERSLTDEQLEALKKMVELFPDADNL